MPFYCSVGGIAMMEDDEEVKEMSNVKKKSTESRDDNSSLGHPLNS